MRPGFSIPVQQVAKRGTPGRLVIGACATSGAGIGGVLNELLQDTHAIHCKLLDPDDLQKEPQLTSLL